MSLADRVPDGYHLIGEAARLVGRSRDTLRYWEEKGIYTASHEMDMGRTTARVYSDEDIVAMRRLALTLRPGRKPRVDD